MTASFDIAVIGSGFAGSLLASIARSLGKSAILIERGEHPRFTIGESSTPLANLLIETLADRYQLPWLRPFSKWGTWQATYPNIGCGLKRGFSFFHHKASHNWSFDPNHTHQLLVAASPSDAIADTHWYRPDFDLFLQAQAVAGGAEYTDKTNLAAPVRDGNGWLLSGTRPSGNFQCRARWLIDASGPRGYLHRHFNLTESSFAGFPKTVGLWSHFSDVHRWESLHPQFQGAPFSPDDAALHHIFDGGWMWILRFNNGMVSAGFALKKDLATEVGIHQPEQAWQKLLNRLPSVRAQFSDAQILRPFSIQDPLAFRTGEASGQGWIQLPTAAGFIDPLFSTGFVLSLLGLERLGRWIEGGMNPAGLADCGRETLADLDTTADLIAATYRVMNDPEAFQSVTHLYFAAASYSETARRLDRSPLAPGFLLRNRPRFYANAQRCFASAGHSPAPVLARQVAETIDEVNIAGLADPAKRNWYRAVAADLLTHAHLLEATPTEISEMLIKTGFSS